MQLHRLRIAALKRGFDPLRENLIATDQLKKETLRSWLRLTEGKQKDMLIRWKKYNQFARHLEACRSVIVLFDGLGATLNTNLNAITEPDHTREKKAEIIRYKHLYWDVLLTF